MRVLFVCWQNVSRSQMAAALYNHMTGTHNADSAGTEVESPGETLGERRRRLGGTVSIEVMRQAGIDISSRKKTQLTRTMLDNYDYVICLADPHFTPEWLRNHPRYVQWKVADPGAMDIEQALRAKEDIQAHIAAFIAKHKTE